MAHKDFGRVELTLVKPLRTREEQDMSRIDIVPEVLWQPNPERVAGARISDFAAFAGARSGRDMVGYGSLWSYSTTDLEGF